LGSSKGFGARPERRDRINQKTVDGMDRLVAIDEISVSEQVQEIVGPRTADDTVGVESERSPDRLAQIARRTVRIIFEVIRPALVGRNRARARSKRRLVGRQL